MEDPVNNTSNTLKPLTYRAEIDGLRAIAIISVILYHAQFLTFGVDYFEGGFVGVDIFFVISGYLITRIIASEILTNHTFNFVNFYSRRIRRILPMLIVVILFSVPIAWYKLAGPDFVEYAESILSSLTIGSNFFFYISTTSYGASSALLKPFLHTWSLGVEEQFYLVFPLLILAGHRYFKDYFIKILILLSLFSLVFATTMEVSNPDLNFFHPFSRLWELSSGSILAFRELSKGCLEDSRLTRFAPIIGLIFIFYAIFVFSPATPHPSIYTLIPIIGVSLIIAYSSKDEVVGKVLAGKPLVGIGVISYSAYLWHFPIFAFGRNTFSIPNNYDKVSWILLTIALSVISYRIIETPFRNKRIINEKLFKRYITVSLSIVTVGAVSIYAADGFPGRSLLKPDLTNMTPMYLAYKKNGKDCFNRQSHFCSEVYDPAYTNVYMLGDSHTATLSFPLLEALKERYNYFDLNASGCPFVLGAVRKNKNGHVYPDCTIDLQIKRYEAISKRPSIVIVGGRFPLYLNKTYFDNTEGGREQGATFWATLEGVNGEPLEELVVATYRKLLDDGHRLIIIYPIPTVGWNLPARMNSLLIGASEDEISSVLEKNAITTSSSVYYDRAKSTFSMLDSLSHPNIHRVYPHKIFCDTAIKGRCITHDKDNLYYFDDDHLSKSGAYLVADILASTIREADLAMR